MNRQPPLMLLVHSDPRPPDLTFDRYERVKDRMPCLRCSTLTRLRYVADDEEPISDPYCASCAHQPLKATA